MITDTEQLIELMRLKLREQSSPMQMAAMLEMQAPQPEVLLPVNVNQPTEQTIDTPKPSPISGTSPSSVAMSELDPVFAESFGV